MSLPWERGGEGDILGTMDPAPFALEKHLDGWTLLWAEVELAADASPDLLAKLRDEVVRRARERFDIETLASHPPVAAMRRLFKAAGTKPSRYRPSSEALLRRLLKGETLPAINPIVDINNCLSAELAVPCCVMAEGTFEAPLEYRAGRPGESYQSLRGPFNLEGKPLLCDTAGPLDCPITGNERVKVTPETRRAWLVAYLPTETLDAERAREALEHLVEQAPVVAILRTTAT